MINLLDKTLQSYLAHPQIASSSSQKAKPFLQQLPTHSLGGGEEGGWSRPHVAVFCCHEPRVGVGRIKITHGNDSLIFCEAKKKARFSCV